MEEAYMDVATNLLHDIRLRIEGAVVIYETDALPLRRLGLENERPISAGAYDTIGSALYDLRQDIQKLYEAHMIEVNGVSK